MVFGIALIVAVRRISRWVAGRVLWGTSHNAAPVVNSGIGIAGLGQCSTIPMPNIIVTFFGKPSKQELRPSGNVLKFRYSTTLLQRLQQKMLISNLKRPRAPYPKYGSKSHPGSRPHVVKQKEGRQRLLCLLPQVLQSLLLPRGSPGQTAPFIPCLHLRILSCRSLSLIVDRQWSHLPQVLHLLHARQLRRKPISPRPRFLRG